jgi:hypothetical protein
VFSGDFVCFFFWDERVSRVGELFVDGFVI